MTLEEFEHIVPLLRPLMVKVGRDFFGNEDDAEDVAQEAMIRLWTYCQQLDASRNLEAFAVKVAKNVCINMYRNRQQHQELSDIHPSPPGYEADSEVIRHETEEMISDSLGNLSPRERELLVMKQMEDKSSTEISEETGIPKRSVQSMIAMAKAKLINDFKRKRQ